MENEKLTAFLRYVCRNVLGNHQGLSSLALCSANEHVSKE